MGTKYVLHFDDEKFLGSINTAKWNIYSIALQDLTFYTLSYLKVIKNYQNTEKSKSVYNYNGLITMILHNYIRHKTGDNYKALLNKIFQNKVKNEYNVQFVEMNSGSEEWGIGDSMVRLTRHDWLRLAKAMMDDYQNDTCVGKYLKELHKRRVPKNYTKHTNEPHYNRTKSYGGQFLSLIHI